MIITKEKEKAELLETESRIRLPGARNGEMGRYGTQGTNFHGDAV